MQTAAYRQSRPITLARSDPRLRPAKLAVAAGVGLLVVSTIGVLRDVEPFASGYYLFAWYSALLAADGALALRGAAGRGIKGEFLLLGRPGFLISLLGWSVVVWLFYELLNFRLQNWYYIFVPDQMAVRWLIGCVAFATVLPAVFMAEAFLNSVRFAERVRWRPLPVTPTLLNRMQIAGVLMMTLVLIWPRYFFPLVWGASMLIVEPKVYRQARERSLLGDLELGQPGRMLRLLAGGAVIGLVWELLNIRARMKWIYTVPFFEDLKLFEMPVLGFLGFPPFAVECFILWQALVCAGVAVPRVGNPFPATTRRRIAVASAAAVFSVAVFAGMDLFTNTSVMPKLSDLPGVPAARLEQAGYDVFRLARSEPALVAADVGALRPASEEWIGTARLAALRGIGSQGLRLLRELEIYSVEGLARARPNELIPRLEASTGEDWVDARVRVWIRGARRTSPPLMD